MGIKDLWSVLTPFCERKPLYELQGKVVAVDLSCWVCEAQNISEYQVQPRMYLRNLYFRTCYLLLMEVTPVFVLEGKAPELKYQTIADRNAVQFKGAKPKSDKVKTGKDRSRFHFVLKQCEDMLRCMGIACVKGNGEAESLCAYLNEDGLVSGCISQDSDCFAYGARVVYRNFSISTQGSYAASGGAVDVYDIQKANDFLKFGRHKIIALALLCGSDYNDGVFGVGRESAMKFMNRYEDDEILNRIRSWRNDQYAFEQMENRINDKNVCTSCGHDGKVQSHTKNGCPPCGTTKGCDFTKYREERLDIKNELAIRTKALVDPDFPNEELIDEYLVKKDKVDHLDLKWKQPDLINFVGFTKKYLGWDEIYALEKFLPVLTRWQLLNHKHIDECVRNGKTNDIKGVIYPREIKKIRNPKGVPSYEIVWCDRHDFFKHLIPEDQLETYKETNKDSLDGLWNTIEPKNLVENAYPDLVARFLDKKNAKKAKKPSKRKPKSGVDEISGLLQNVSISEPKPKRTRAKTVKKPQKNTLDDFVKANKENVDNGDETKETGDDTLVNELLSKYGSTTLKTKVNILKEEARLETSSNSFDFNASRFGDEDDLNISDVIDEIVNRKFTFPSLIDTGYEIVDPLTTNEIEVSNRFVLDDSNITNSSVNEIDGVEEHVSLSGDDSSLSSGDESMSSRNNSTPLKSDERRGRCKQLTVLESSFFGSNVNDNEDLFENSVRKDYSSGDDTIECDNIEMVQDDDDSDDGYVPLVERLKARMKDKNGVL